jgi:hypothetical protein
MKNLSISTEYTVWCARCNYWDQRQSQSKLKFARSCRKQGWCIREGKTVCPECAEELKKGSDWEDVGYRHVDR